jgi:CsoR family transcriptional regulator, copper-sensing transcriptional repressor
LEHHHPHTETKKIVNRLASIEGHVRAIKEMTSNGRDCPEILLQIAAAQKALEAVAKIILKDHLEHCIVSGIERGDTDKVLSDLQIALDHFIR